MRLWLWSAFAAIVVLAGGATAAARVSVVDHWALYAASRPGQPYHLFLEPFPNQKTCDVDGAEIRRSGGLAYCSDHRELSFDPRREWQLVWEFFGPENPWSRLCR